LPALAFSLSSWENQRVTKPSVHLRKILEKVKETSAQKSQDKKSLVVFDLDSTLFDVSPRIQRILQDFGNNPEYQTRFPDGCRILQNIETQRSDWGFKDALIRAGLDGHHPDFYQALKESWKKTFFSNEYLKYDVPYNGALEFVQALYEAGADIVYLTGRDVARMGVGTDQILLHWKFPLDQKRALSCLKPQKEMDDAKFKSDFFAKIPANTYSNIWLFENEPVNIHLVRNDHTHVEIIYFDSTHSSLASPPTDLPTILHYLLDE
jgi:hypothetical protein